jgi:hypothetical protein
MQNAIQKSYESYKILISKEHESETWGTFGICIKYSVVISKDKEKSSKKFFVPLATDIKVEEDKIPDMILREVKKIIHDNLFDNEHYQEFVYVNGVFKNVTIQ